MFDILKFYIFFVFLHLKILSIGTFYLQSTFFTFLRQAQYLLFVKKGAFNGINQELHTLLAERYEAEISNTSENLTT
ncbi:hypothetical protein BpHYR1_009630 [Brachionus plicatilis]|uniref:Uncharacterized protein n=1 Tax=Brachionus plicatilis TaxID=10195 RepID=A0A3M7T9A8_BRAPC|nr:hypothetical protein BpHYR1_009630 [Brachionus plicatilis]